MTVHFKQVTIVGVGLIGGSLGMILKQQGLADQVVGVGRTIENLELAIKIGAIDRHVQDPQLVMPGTDLVILATPIESYSGHLKQWGRYLAEGTIVSDVGSVKGPLVEQAESLMPPGVHFVGAHPIAGKEKSGAGAATSDLYQNALCLLTPTARTNAEALGKIRHMWEVAGSNVHSIDPFLHDWILGAVSHLPHVAAFALMNALSDLQQHTKGDAELLNYSGGGLRDTTRIAASSPEMWRDIFLWNKDNLVLMIETLEKHLQRMKSYIQQNDEAGIEHEIAKARDARQRLK
ncbi:prephenate dehydrogenase [Candidatus Nitronereus thalassa]|uniref:Prephenate dehydrogenase/arogenate dehydrogenase family protein n=1 Tax=Candidatus Nitronereus thalassa TaxID=3020898 RepID=A0ABU3K9M9_9BACT|nr:prephenate dehydrogenase/arogenate dehydrogenase family protein [Candidatus Nitronereus thalassa]MDT7043150.1 prephenate dehydrogenase/arogenate dehydrogenase family protein [Candidatus Nitronereus thalassa]